MDMKGWDTISFLRTEAVDRQFAAAYREEMGQFQYSGDGLTLEGCFGPPKIIPGGSGKALRISLPIVSGTVTVGVEQRILSGCECCIAVMLQFLPHEDGQALGFDLRQLAKTPEEAEPGGGWVLPIDFFSPEGQIPKLWRRTILECVCQYFIEYPSFFSRLLAYVASQQASERIWSIPGECAYAYLDSTPPVLCVLGICGIQWQSELPLTIDPPPISAGAVSCLAISGPLFLSNMFIPALNGQFPGVSAGIFEPQEGWLQNLIPLDMASLVCGGQEYAPTAQTVRLKISGSQISMEVSGNCDLDPLDAGLEFTLDIRFSLTVSGQAALCRVVTASEQHTIHGGCFSDIPIAGGLVKLLLKEFSGNLIQRLDHSLSDTRIFLELDAVSWLGEKSGRLLSARLENCLLLEYGS